MKKRLVTLALAAAILIQTLPSPGLVAYAATAEEETTPAQTVETVENTDPQPELPLEIPENAPSEDNAPAVETPVQEEVKEEAPTEELAEPAVEEIPQVEPVVEEEVKVQPEKITFTVVIANILQTNGTSKDYTTSFTLSQGSSNNKARKWFENKVNAKSFSYKGTKYTFTG